MYFVKVWHARESVHALPESSEEPSSTRAKRDVPKSSRGCKSVPLPIVPVRSAEVKRPTHIVREGLYVCHA